MGDWREGPDMELLIQAWEFLIGVARRRAIEDYEREVLKKGSAKAAANESDPAATGEGVEEAC